ncbi:Zinc-finger double domain containing protein, partial [Euroglyphus maynei]
MELQILQRENQKLATITRLCIHLVDRCRTLNKTKQFIEDLSRLGILIDEFNHFNTKKNSQLPTFGNSGLVFDGGHQNNHNMNNTTTLVRGKSNPTNTLNNNNNLNQSTTTMMINNQSTVGGDSIGANMYLIPITMGPNQQGQPQQYQLIQTTNDTAMISGSPCSS